MRHRRSIYAAAALALAIANVGHADTRVWTGGAGPNNRYFDSPANWSPSGAPGSGDTALFNLSSTYEVAFDDFTGDITNNFLDVEAGNVAFAHDAGSLHTYTTPTITVDNGATFQLTGLMKFVNTNGFINRGSSIIVNNFATFQSAGILHFGGGGTAAENKFIIHAGGTANTASVNLGEAAGFSARATLDGANAVWTLTDDLNIGLSGTGFVNVSAGGRVSGIDAWIGRNNGALGTVTVANANSTFTMSKNLLLSNGSFTTSDNARVGIGNNAPTFGGGFSIGAVDLSGNNGGNVFISNGSTLTHNAGGPIQIAGAGNTYGRVQVTGTGSSVSTNNAIQVGLQGIGVIDLSGGGSATMQDLVAGVFTNATGTITIGSGSVLQANGNALFGTNGGTATETISAGGRMNVGNGSAGGLSLGMVLADTDLGGGGGGNLTINAGSTVTHSSGNTAYIGIDNKFGRATVTGTNANWINNNGSGIAIGLGANAVGFVNVLAGGRIEASGMTVGGFGGTGTVLVDGANSVVKLNRDLTLSSPAGAGTGLVTTTNGAKLLVGDAASDLGASFGVVVNDASPIGTDGGMITVSNGSKLKTADSAILGVANGQSGRATVSGTGSEWAVPGQILLGNGSLATSRGELIVNNGGRVSASLLGLNGTSSLSVSGGGRVETTTQAIIGQSGGTTGTVTVAGASSVLAVGSELFLAYDGTGTLNINTGGKVSVASDAVIGANANTVGSIVMNDGNSLLDIERDLVVGYAAGGTDSITHNNGFIRVGDAGGSPGAYPFDVSDSNLDGSNGGNVRFDNGATYAGNQIVTLGEAANTRGSLTVAGGASFNPGGGLLVGNFGTGVLKLQSGGKVTVGTNGVFLSYAGPGSGTVTIDGTGSSLLSLSNLALHRGSTLTSNTGGGFIVGDNAGGFATNVATVGNNSSSNGKLTIDGGSVVTHTGDAILTPNANTFGSVLVSGTNSLFKLNGNLFSYVGTSDLRIEAGGKVEATNSTLQFAPTGQLTATVTGTNSILNITGNGMTVGEGGAATLNITSGGTVKSAGTLLVGNNSGSNGTINLSGSGSLLDVATTLTIGGNGTGSVNLSGGTLKAPTITRGASSNFSFTGGRLETKTYTGSLTQNGGTFAPSGLNNNGSPTTLSGTYTLAAGNVEIHLGSIDDSRIFASGAVALNGGNLALSVDDYTPVLGNNFTVIAGSSVTGHFATVSGVEFSPTRSFAITYNGSTVNYVVALPGDATLSNGVGFQDLVVLAQNYNLTGRVWVTGDFNGTGVTDFADLVILAQHYGQTSLGLPEGVSPDFASDWALAQSMVPEPTALLTVSSLAGLALRRRR